MNSPALVASADMVGMTLSESGGSVGAGVEWVKLFALSAVVLYHSCVVPFRGNDLQ